ncbi:hypothetical protein CVS40_10308 [Lucilia cuprina]|nr:hypothetical protein CVS40_10308 [Lucilia cuprina]
MVINYNKNNTLNQSKIGRGLVNTLINKLPFELHLPGYQFCGPGTKLKERLERGDKGINLLDSACREHDIAYSLSKDLNKRHQADQILAEKAWQRVKSKDSTFKERANAWFVTNAMKTKVKFGLGMKNNNKIHKSKKSKKKGKRKRKICNRKLFSNTVKNTLKLLKKENPDNIRDAVKIAKKVVHTNFKRKRRANIGIPRVIPIPKIGGFLPLIPILTALSALGGLATGGSAIVKAVNSIKNGKEQLAEATRHNKHMEAIAMEKRIIS